MTGSNNPSDPATVKAQVEELKEALADLHAFKTETQKVIGPQKWADTDNPVNGLPWRSRTVGPLKMRVYRK